jgi:hypothetical protein
MDSAPLLTVRVAFDMARPDYSTEVRLRSTSGEV